jgi:hypothetical protein
MFLPEAKYSADEYDAENYQRIGMIMEEKRESGGKDQNQNDWALELGQ